MYEIDYEHVIDKKIGGVDVTKNECKIIWEIVQWLGCNFG